MPGGSQISRVELRRSSARLGTAAAAAGLYLVRELFRRAASGGIVPGLVTTMRRVPYLVQITVVAAIYLVAAKLSPCSPFPRLRDARMAAFGNRAGGCADARRPHLARDLGRRGGCQPDRPGIVAVRDADRDRQYAGGAGRRVPHPARYVGLPYRFERGEDVLKFVAIVFSSAAIAATTGVTSLAAGGAVAWSDYFANWWTWLGGDAADDHRHAVAPELGRTRGDTLVMAGGRGTRLLLAAADRGRVRDAGARRAGLAAAFRAPTRSCPFIIWATFRFSQREVNAAIAAVCAVAVGYTVAGRGLVRVADP